MNKDQAAGKFSQVQGKAKRVWAELTDDDVKRAEGSVDKLYGIIQERFGDEKEAAIRKINELEMPF
ncbi:MAG: CsbD family protein [Nannocystaceae bacterium]